MKKNRFAVISVVLLMTAVVNASASLIDSVEIEGNRITVSGSLHKEDDDKVVGVNLLWKNMSLNMISESMNPAMLFANMGTAPVNSSGEYTYTFESSQIDPQMKIYVKSKNYSIQVNAESFNAVKEIYVSPNGSDYASGTADEPLLTIDAAREKARKIIDMYSLTDDFVIYLYGGEYYLDDTVSFTLKDSGTEYAKIIYRAVNNEIPIIKGSKTIDINKFVPVTDAQVRSRILPGVCDKIYMNDLSQYGITSDMLTIKNTGGANIAETASTVRPTGLYLNKKLQTLARWPNNGYITADSVDNNTGSFVINNERIDRWINAQNAFAEGYFNNQWSGLWDKIESIDTTEKRIKLKNTSILNTNRRISVVNLLEEIDVPGEFYIDSDNCILYYYPPYELDAQKDRLELSVLDKSLFSLNKVSNVSFEGIHFENNYASAISMNDCNYVTVDNCTVGNVSGAGINARGKNISIKNCTVYNTGAIGIQLSSEVSKNDRINLIGCGNVVENNHVYNSGYASTPQGTNVFVSGIGARVVNNLLHKSNYSAIMGGGIDSVIGYNEAYNLLRNTADGGAVYFGGSWVKYGSVIEYNYFHDLGIEGFNETAHTSNIFWDDTISGQTARYNILVNNYITNNKVYGIFSGGGRDNTAQFNTIVGQQNEAIMGQDRTYNQKIINTDSLLSRANELKMTAEEENSKTVETHPEIKKLYDEIFDENGNLYEDAEFIPKNSNYTNNLFANNKKIGTSPRVKAEENNPLLEPNAYTDDYSIFVDPQNQDWRVKNEKKNELGISDEILDESFDLNSIGINKEEIDLSDKYRKIYPENNSLIECGTVEFFWEIPLFADEYDYVVARDKELLDIVASGTTSNNYISIENLDENTDYYWNVTAKHTSRRYSAIMPSDEEVFKFTVVKPDILVTDSKINTDSNTVNVSVLYNGGEPKQYKYISALYDKDGKLVKCSFKPIEASVTQNVQTFNMEFDLSEVEEGYYIVNYLWDNYGKMMPASEKIYPRLN
ncbi:MAG: right-handed parallel beta-helix repeat-containing protein [Clostridia bacterium]|nr:right-handed parallel beta-helix repeat-containing protein [Clostridia bacterium]